MEEEKERKNRVGFGIRCQRFLLRYRLSNMKVVALIGIAALIGLSVFVLSDTPTPNNKQSITDIDIDVPDFTLSNKEKDLLKMERNIEEHKAELQLKEQELKELETLLRQKEEILKEKLNKLDNQESRKDREEQTKEEVVGGIDHEKRNAVKQVTFN
jgi:hypothetical protein